MRLQHLKIKNFRNLETAALEVSPGTTVLLGENGAGKTNTLEAIFFALCGKSFRTRKDLEMVMEGKGFLRVEARGRASGSGFERIASLGADGRERRGDTSGSAPLPVICFTPDDLSLVKGPPAQRRLFIDRVIARRRPQYARTTADFREALSQRNSFLGRARSGLVDLSEIAPWDRQVAALSAKVYGERLGICSRIEEPFRRTYGEISGNGTGAELVLVSQLSGFDGEDVEEALLERLKERWHIDLESGMTGLGAHRDDIDFRICGRSVRSHGSQGEQRSAVLALLLAEVEMTSGSEGEKPLVLLDDVMSELDPDRRQLLTRRLSLAGQIIITAADKALVPEEEWGGNVLYEVGGGCIKRTRAAINA